MVNTCGTTSLCSLHQPSHTASRVTSTHKDSVILQYLLCHSFPYWNESERPQTAATHPDLFPGDMVTGGSTTSKDVWTAAEGHASILYCVCYDIWIGLVCGSYIVPNKYKSFVLCYLCRHRSSPACLISTLLSVIVMLVFYT